MNKSSNFIYTHIYTLCKSQILHRMWDTLHGRLDPVGSIGDNLRGSNPQVNGVRIGLSQMASKFKVNIFVEDECASNPIRPIFECVYVVDRTRLLTDSIVKT